MGVDVGVEDPSSGDTSFEADGTCAEIAHLLPEETLPGGEVGALEEGVLEDALHAAQRLDDVRAVVVEVPQLAVVALVCPPEGVQPRHLELLELRAHPPPLVVRQRVPVLLEERVDARDAAVPRVLRCIYKDKGRSQTIGCGGFSNI
eukprot:5685478-Pyramimonas_sp.AAC.1